MTRHLAYYVREGCHGEWCIDQEQMSPQGRFISRAASKADAERLAKELNTAAGVLKIDEPKRDTFTVLEAVKICRSAYIENDAFVRGLEKHGFKIVEK